MSTFHQRRSDRHLVNGKSTDMMDRGAQRHACVSRLPLMYTFCRVWELKAAIKLALFWVRRAVTYHAQTKVGVVFLLVPGALQVD